MKTRILIALCLSSTLCLSAFADPISITPTPTQQAGLQYATDAYNATAKTEFNAATKAQYLAAQALLPVNQRVAYNPATLAQYVPLTATQYAAWRFSDVLDSYARAQFSALASDPASQALFQKALSLPKEQQDAIRAAINAQ